MFASQADKEENQRFHRGTAIAPIGGSAPQFAGFLCHCWQGNRHIVLAKHWTCSCPTFSANLHFKWYCISCHKKWQLNLRPIYWYLSSNKFGHRIKMICISKGHNSYLNIEKWTTAFMKHEHHFFIHCCKNTITDQTYAKYKYFCE